MQDLSQLTQAVQTRLTKQVGAEIVREWGAHTLQGWVADSVSQGVTKPSAIARDIIADYHNAQ